jgi:hypothetical protein
MYRVSYENIKKIDTMRRTESTVWYIDYNGIRCSERMTSTNVNWFETFEEAKQFLVNKLNSEIGSLEGRISIVRHKLAIIDKLQEN